MFWRKNPESKPVQPYNEERARRNATGWTVQGPGVPCPPPEWFHGQQERYDANRSEWARDYNPQDADPNRPKLWAWGYYPS